MSRLRTARRVRHLHRLVVSAPLALLCGLILAACAGPESADLARTVEVKEARDLGALARSLKTAEACKAEGGVWGRGGLNPDPFCNMRYADAGKACRDASECGGLCIADEGQDAMSRSTGVCQTFTSQFGCYGLVEDGVAGPTLCVD